MSRTLETRDLDEVCKHLFAGKAIPAELARRVDEEGNCRDSRGNPAKVW
jgi:hypothetical protein